MVPVMVARWYRGNAVSHVTCRCLLIGWGWGLLWDVESGRVFFGEEVIDLEYFS